MVRLPLLFFLLFLKAGFSTESAQSFQIQDSVGSNDSGLEEEASSCSLDGSLTFFDITPNSLGVNATSVSNVQQTDWCLCYFRTEDEVRHISCYDDTPHLTCNAMKGTQLRHFFNLEAFVEYDVCVVQHCNGTSGNSFCQTTRTKFGIPSPPQNLRTTGVDYNQVALQWEPPLLKRANITEYQVFINGNFTHTVYGLNLVVDGLQSETTYTFQVRAVSKDQVEGENATIDITTTYADPVAPDNLSLDPFRTYVTATWIEPASFRPLNGYLILACIKGTQCDRATLANNRETSVNITELRTYTEYTIHVFAVYLERGFEMLSPDVNKKIRTKPGKPALVEDAYFTLRNATAAEISWIAPPEVNGLLKGFKISWTAGGKSGNTVVSAADKTNDKFSLLLTDLQEWSLVNVLIIAYNRDDGDQDVDGDVHTLTFQTPPAGDFPPRDIKFTLVNNSIVFLTWNPPQPDKAIDTYEAICCPTGSLDCYWGSTKENFTFVGELLPDTSYVCKVRTLVFINNHDLRSSEPEIYFRTQPDNAFGPVLNVSATAGTDGDASVIVTWIRPISQANLPSEYRIELCRNVSCLTYRKPNHFDNLVETFQSEPLQEYSNYTAQVFAIYWYEGLTVESDPGKAATVTTMPGRPGSVTNFVVKDDDSNNMTLSWEPPLKSERRGPIDGYYIDVCPTESKADCQRHTLKTTGNDLFPEYTVWNLKVYTEYLFIVSAYNLAGEETLEGARSEKKSRTPPSAPSEIRNLKYDVVDAWEVKLWWDEPADKNGPLDGYLVIACVRDSELPCSENETTVPAITFRELTQRTEYWFRVKAYNNRSGVPLFSQAQSANVTTVAAAPPTPADLRADTSLSTLVSLFWDKSNDTKHVITHYVLYTNGSSQTINASLTTCTVSGLKPWTTYIFFLQACNVQFCSLNASTSGKTAPAEPSKPIDLSLDPINPWSFRATWSEPSERNGPLDGYDMEFCMTNNSDSCVLNETTATTAVFENLRQNTEYMFRVRAFNLGQPPQYSEYVEDINVTPAAIPPPPEGIKMAIASTSVEISWTPMTDSKYVVTHYNVSVCGKAVDPVDGSRNQILLSDLNPWSNYSISIATCYGELCSQDLSLSAQTHPDAPGVVKAMTVTSESATSLCVKWSAPDKPNGPIDGYQLMWKVNNSAVVDHQTRNIPSTSFTIGDLLQDTVYEVSVVAYNLDSSSNHPLFGLLSRAEGRTQKAAHDEKKVTDDLKVILPSVLVPVLALLAIMAAIFWCRSKGRGAGFPGFFKNMSRNDDSTWSFVNTAYSKNSPDAT